MRCAMIGVTDAWQWERANENCSLRNVGTAFAAMVQRPRTPTDVEKVARNAWPKSSAAVRLSDRGVTPSLSAKSCASA